MYLNPLSVNNFNYSGGSKAQNVSAPVQMRSPLAFDTVSFGNSTNEARTTVIKVVKDIFKQLESSKNSDVSEASKKQFSDMAEGIFAKLGKNMENIKNAELSKRYDEDIMMKDGAGVHLYKTWCGYIFDHVSPTDNELLNSIEIGYDGSAKLVSMLKDKDGQTVARRASAILDKKPVITSLEI